MTVLHIEVHKWTINTLKKMHWIKPTDASSQTFGVNTANLSNIKHIKQLSYSYWHVTK